MKVALAVFGVLAFLGLVVGLNILGTYNDLIKRNEVVSTNWAQVETQYQRRFDLIPNLVNATKGFLRQEQKVFGDIAEARTRYAGTAAGSDERVRATNGLESALSRLLVIIENYPVLQSNQTVRELMDELSGTENRISVSRQRYNEVVRDYNVRVKTFPANLIAGLFGFEEKPFFESEEGSEKAPNVNLDL